jgi:UDP-N-acetylmuramoylalanine--D-glutamate ligase
MDASAHFKGKKVTLMRIGLLGRGVGDAAYLARNGAEVLVVDDAPQSVMQPSVDALKEYPNITFKFGAYDLADFKDCDLILKGAGTPMDSPEIAEAHKNNIPVRMSADLFAELSGVTCIGITGTRGKSTTTHMLAAILEWAGKQVLLGGNVRGVSTLALLDEVTEGDKNNQVAVLELDSWQCQGFGEAKISPHIAVFTTFYPDHLNYYKGDLDAYLADKANIFLYQVEQDNLIVGSQAAEAIRARYQDEILADLFIASEADIPKDWQLKVPGEHNRYDAALALAAARAYGVADGTNRQALESFAGVPGRLELVREMNGIKIYNDTNSTTPEATLAALEALRNTSGQNQNLILILGGNDKGLDMNKLLLEIPKHAKRVILLPGTGTDRVLEFLPGASVYGDLESAVEEAMKAAQPGDTVLFSPAFTSFGMFKNEYDRGDQFNALVQAS